MSTIRRQSIISSGITYIGFAIGLLNTYFMTREGFHFTEEQYGLTSLFVNISGLMMALAVMAMPSYIFKFYHYYNDHLPPRKNDMLTWSLLVGLIGFLLVMIAGYFLKDLVTRKFTENSADLVKYYYWLFPMGLGLSIFTILEAYTWSQGKSVVTVFLREVQWRVFITILIVLVIMGLIKDFGLFIKLYSLTYAGIAVCLFIYLLVTGKIHFTFSPSKVTRRFLGKIVRLCTFFYAGTIMFSLSQVFDTIVIASLLKDGAAMAGIFALAQIMTSVIQAPQRGVIAASITHLSKAWKEKDRNLLQRVYQRSSINLLIFSSGIFALIALNYREAIITFHLKEAYLAGFGAFILLGMTRVIDMGTGVNAQIIATSTYWKFELVSGIILLSFMLPLTYILTKQYGLIGPAIANLVSVSIYNTVRIIFLWKKFRLFPFSMQSVYTVLLAAACFAGCYFAFAGMYGFGGLVVRSTAFLLLFGAGTLYLKLSPDILPVFQTIQKRLGLRKR
jgi:O-antigen/teichoic acid export membrane protein